MKFEDIKAGQILYSDNDDPRIHYEVLFVNDDVACITWERKYHPGIYSFACIQKPFVGAYKILPKKVKRWIDFSIGTSSKREFAHISKSKEEALDNRVNKLKYHEFIGDPIEIEIDEV